MWGADTYAQPSLKQNRYNLMNQYYGNPILRGGKITSFDDDYSVRTSYIPTTVPLSAPAEPEEFAWLKRRVNEMLWK